MKKLLQVFALSAFLAPWGVTSWAVKPFPTDPVERAKALERYKQGLGLYSKGQKLHGEGKFAEANATYGEAMALFRDGPKPDMANSYNRLGNTFLDKEPELALWYYGKALSIRRQDHGEAHEAVASSYNNMGMTCMRMQEYDRALACFEAGMDITMRAAAKRNNGRMGAGHGLIASAYTAKEEHGEAVKHLEKALSVFLKVFGAKHPNIARAKRDLGFALIENGNKERGMKMLLEAKDMFIATEGAGYDETKELIRNIKELE